MVSEAVVIPALKPDAMKEISLAKRGKRIRYKRETGQVLRTSVVP